MGYYITFNHPNAFFCLYDFSTGKETEFNIEKLDKNNVETINKLFETIKKNVNVTVEWFLVLIDATCYNEFRKKFIETAKSQGNIKNVEIFGMAKTLLFGAIYNLSFLPKKGDVIWVFRITETYLFFYIWIYDKNEKWKFQATYVQEKGSATTIKDLENLKLQIKEDNVKPRIFVHHSESFVNENEFKLVFSNSQKIIFRDCFKPHYLATWLSFYARFLMGDNKYLKYNSDAILGRDIKILKNMKENEKICFIGWSKILPLFFNVNFTVKAGDNLNIYEYENLKKNIPIQEEGNHSITIDIDINGIYIVTLIHNGEQMENMKLFYIPNKLTLYDPDQYAVGIDFGTTECCAAVIKRSGPDFVQLDPLTSSRTMPSYVAYDEKKPICGQAVINRMCYKTEYSMYDIKRIIGSKPTDKVIIDRLWPFKVEKSENGIFIRIETFNGQQTLSPEEIAGDLLRHIKSVTETFQGQTLKETVITIPCEFTHSQKSSLKMAAEIAGWETVHFLPEPVAAAFAYFSETDIPPNSNILICDCGGGTVDICIAHVSNGQIKIICFEGDSNIGGRDFDRALFNHFSTILNDKYRVDVMKTAKKFELKQKCQDIKHTLSVCNNAWIDVCDYVFDGEGIIEITKDEFETMTANLLLRIKNVINNTLSKANMEKGQINYVFQVGGGCRMPMIKDMLENVFRNANRKCLLYPDWAVAHGAALYAYYIKTKEHSSDIEAKKPTTSWWKKLF